MILDTTVLIEAERTGRTIREILAGLPDTAGLAISAVTVMELAEGVARAKDDATRDRRREFLEAVQSSFHAVPFDSATAVAAGLLNGDLRRTGVTIGLADAMIAATALRMNCAVATSNARHFKRSPGSTLLNSESPPCPLK